MILATSNFASSLEKSSTLLLWASLRSLSACLRCFSSVPPDTHLTITEESTTIVFRLWVLGILVFFSVLSYKFRQILFLPLKRAGKINSVPNVLPVNNFLFI